MPPEYTPAQPQSPPPAQSKSRLLTPARLAGFLIVLLLVVTAIAVVVQHHRKPQIAATPVRATVHITGQGFQPGTLGIKAGTQVVWISDDGDKTHIVASNPYPSDKALPGLKSAQLGDGAKFSYTFTHKGSYSYHDDLNPSLTGTITVLQ